MASVIGKAGGMIALIALRMADVDALFPKKDRKWIAKDMTFPSFLSQPFFM